MDFYKHLSKVYDIVFQKDQDTVDFLKNGMKKGDNILDLACGTGTYSLEMANNGFETLGLDMDEDMIKIANAKKKNEKMDFYQGDMTKFKKITGDKRFNRIFCIGNSIVHIKDKAEIQAFIKEMYSALSEEGSVIIQIINYDRILKNNIKALPTIVRNDQGVKFVRKYNYTPEKEILYFDTELIILKGNKEESYRSSVPLIPLISNELKEMFNNAGFSKIEMLGDFNGEKYNEDSYALVVKGYK